MLFCATLFIKSQLGEVCHKDLATIALWDYF